MVATRNCKSRGERMGAAPKQSPDQRVAEFQQRLRARRRRSRQGHRRPSRGGAKTSHRALRRRPYSDRRRSRPGQNADGQNRQRGARPQLQAHPVHPRSDARRYHRHPGADRGQRASRVRLQARTDFRAHGAGRRDQSRHAEDAIGRARSDGRAPGHRVRRDLSPRSALHRARDAKSHRARRHLSACPRRRWIASSSKS